MRMVLPLIILFFSCAHHESSSDDNLAVNDSDTLSVEEELSDDFLVSDNDTLPESESFWDLRFDWADRDFLAGMLPTDDGGFIIAVENEDVFAGLNGALLIRYNNDFSERWRYYWPDAYVRVNNLSYGYDSLYLIVSGGSGDSFYLAAFDTEKGELLWEKTWKYDWQVELNDSLNELGEVVAGTDGLFMTGLAEGWPKGGHTSYTRIYVAKTDFDGNLIWEKIYGNGGDVGGYIALDGEGNIYVTGYTASSLGDQHNAGKIGDCADMPFGPAEISSCPDPYLMKLDGEGYMLWARQWGSAFSSPFDWGIAVVTDSKNNIYVLSVLGHQQWGDSTIRKYDPNGVLLWEYHSAPSFYYDSFSNLYLDARGILWALGDSGTRTWDSQHPTIAAFDTETGRRLKKKLYEPLPDEMGVVFSFSDMVEMNGKALLGAHEIRTSLSDDDIINLAFKWIDYFYEGSFLYNDETCDGEFNSTYQFGTEAEDIPVAVATTSDGSLFIVGNTEGAFPGNTSRGLGDIFVMKRSFEGETLWIRQLGTSDNDVATAAVVDGEGNLFVTGHTYGHFTHHWWRHFDPDAFLAKITPDGYVAWIQQVRTDDEDYGTALAVTKEKTILLYGYTRGSLDGLPKDETECYDKVNSDLFLTEWAQEGTLVWIKQWGGDKDDVSTGMTLDDKGNIFVTGYTQSALEGNTLLPDCQYYGEPCFGAFASKRTRGGDKIWTQVWQKANSYETRIGEQIRVKTDGSVIVSGMGVGILLDPSSQEYSWSRCYPSLSCRDIFISDLSPEGDLNSTQFVGTLFPENSQEVVVKNDTVMLMGYTFGSMAEGVSYGGPDCFVMTLGETPKTVQFGTAGEDICRAAAWDEKASSLVIVGETRSAFKGCTNTGNSDGFIVRMPLPE